MSRQNQLSYLERAIPVSVLPADVVQSHLSAYESAGNVINRMMRDIKEENLDHDLFSEIFGYTVDLDALNRFPDAREFLLEWLQEKITTATSANSFATELHYLSEEFEDILRGLKEVESVYLASRRRLIAAQALGGLICVLYDYIFWGMYKTRVIPGALFILLFICITGAAGVMALQFGSISPNEWCNERAIQDVISNLPPAIIGRVETTPPQAFARGFIACFTKVEDQNQLQDSSPTQRTPFSGFLYGIGIFRRQQHDQTGLEQQSLLPQNQV